MRRWTLLGFLHLVTISCVSPIEWELLSVIEDDDHDQRGTTSSDDFWWDHWMRAQGSRALKILRSQYDDALGATSAAGSDATPYLSALTSSLAAYALSRYCSWDAMRELSAVLGMQQADGLVPAYGFPLSTAYQPLIGDDGIELGTLSQWRDGTDSGVIPLAAMPIQASVALQVYRGCEDRSAAAGWAAEIVPKLYRWHAFLRRERQSDLDADLVELVHRLEVATMHLPTSWSSNSSVVDVEFNVALFMSEFALAALCEALERRDMLSRKLLSAAERDDVYKAKYRAYSALDALWRDGCFRSMERVDDTWTPRPMAISDLAPLALPGLSSQRADALITRLIDRRAKPSFACGLPLPDLACGEPNLVVRLDQNLIIERALRSRREVGLADWLRDSTLHFVGNRTFYRVYAQDASPILEDPQANRSALAAAVIVLLTTPDADEDYYPDAPVSGSIVLAVVLVELIVACLVASTCFATNLLMIKTLRRAEDNDAFSSNLSPSGRSPRRYTTRPS